MQRGIDVSSAQGNINWNLVKPSIDFAIIHINSGTSQSVESKFLYNATECERLGIPYGAYWFCYDLTAQDAYNSGVAAGQIISQNNLTNTYPIYYDFEATGDPDNPGSVEWLVQHGISVTPALVQSLIESFCNGVESQGLSAGVYFNASMYTQYQYQTLFANHPSWSKWIAQWNSTQPTWTTWDFWQYSETGIVSGISGNVDLDYKDDGYNPPTPPTPTRRKLPIWMYLKFPF